MDTLKYIGFIAIALFAATIITFIYIKVESYLKKHRPTTPSPLKRKRLKKIAIIIFTVLLTVTSSYWFIVRPYVTAKNCHNVALDNSGYNKDNEYSRTYWGHDLKTQAPYMFFYEVCMHKDGINP